MAPLFEAFLPKPDLYVDDRPATFLKSEVLCVSEEADDWQRLADRIVRDHVQVRK